jgi:cytochrome c oxidase subunit 2
MNDGFRLHPEQASEIAASVDALYFFQVGVTVFFTVLIFVLIWTFALKYGRARKADRILPPHEFWATELIWAIVPFAIVMIMFGWSAVIFVRGSQTPPNAITIDVIGKQWMWRIYHPEGKREINTLHVPVGQPVRLRMISDDVIHSFYIPAFRAKMDVLPGRHTFMSFTATKPGEYHLFCAEYCGTQHSFMRGRIVVMEPGVFADWIRGSTDEPPEVAGKQLFEQFRCNNCHHNNPGARCPPLGGIYGTTVALQDGTTVTADESYLRESILNPAAHIVAGYKNEMPLYLGQLGEEDVLQLIAYIKTLPSPDATPRSEAENSKP